MYLLVLAQIKVGEGGTIPHTPTNLNKADKSRIIDLLVDIYIYLLDLGLFGLRNLYG